MDVETVAVAGEWIRHAPHRSALLGRAVEPTDGRWQRGEVVRALYLADERATAVAEWYRLLAERGLPPARAIPHDHHVWEIRLELADLSTPERLAWLGLHAPQPGRRTWPPYQTVGERLLGEGYAGILAPSAARKHVRRLCRALRHRPRASSAARARLAGAAGSSRRVRHWSLRRGQRRLASNLGEDRGVQLGAIPRNARSAAIALSRGRPATTRHDDRACRPAVSGSRGGRPPRLLQNRTYASRIRLFGTAGYDPRRRPACRPRMPTLKRQSGFLCRRLYVTCNGYFSSVNSRRLVCSVRKPVAEVDLEGEQRCRPVGRSPHPRSGHRQGTRASRATGRGRARHRSAAARARGWGRRGEGDPPRRCRPNAHPTPAQEPQTPRGPTRSCSVSCLGSWFS